MHNLLSLGLKFWFWIFEDIQNCLSRNVAKLCINTYFDGPKKYIDCKKRNIGEKQTQTNEVHRIILQGLH